MARTARRLGRAALCVVLGAVAPARAADVVTLPLLDPPAYLEVMPADDAGRLLADVVVNGAGPFRFILDLGANRSALSSRLAQHLGLEAPHGSAIAVHGVTGTARVPLVHVDRLDFGEISLEQQRLPVLEGAVFADADGILGIDGLQHARIDVNPESGTVTIETSEGRRAPRGYLTVPARLVSNGLLVVSGRVGHVPTQIVIDTGAEYTIGNHALQFALSRHGMRRGAEAAILGATPGLAQGRTHAAPGITIGEARLHNLPVTFSDVQIFSHWGLGREPALIIGMDALRQVDRFVVDYPRREFHIKTRRQAGATVQNCTTSNCGTRLRRANR